MALKMADQHAEEHIAECKDAFARFDKDGDDRVASKQLVSCMTFLQTPWEVKLQDMNDDANADRHGTHELPRCVSLMARTMADQLPEEQIAKFKEAFTRFDKGWEDMVATRELGSVME